MIVYQIKQRTFGKDIETPHLSCMHSLIDMLVQQLGYCLGVDLFVSTSPFTLEP